MNLKLASAFRLSALTLLVLSFASIESATAQTAAKKPNFSGFWTLAQRVPQDKELMSKIAPNTAFINDAGAPELPEGDYGGLKLKPEALAAAKKWDPAREQMDLSKVCLAP